MPEPLTLTRQHLTTFLACRRQFQLRFREAYPWPVRPQDEAQQRALLRGQQFHEMLHRHFLGLPVAAPGGDPLLEEWWQRFVEAGPSLPPGRRLPELSVTVPLGSYLLAGRLDLLILNGDEAHIVDWKTARLRGEAALRGAWQTWLYPALVVAAGRALHPQGKPIAPENVSLTYWSPATPGEPVHLAYSAAAHEQTWSQLVALAGEIDAISRLPGDWPLTEEFSICSSCRYRVLCGRQFVVPRAAGDRIAEERPDYHLEPDLP
jgi:hypothetical protein